MGSSRASAGGWGGSRRWLCVLFLPLVLSTAEAAAQEGTPLLIELPPGALGIDVGANGFVVLGNFYSGAGALTWMPTAGVTPLGGTQGAAISRDGKTIVGSALDANGKENAAIWTGGADWRLLGSFTPAAQSCDRSLSSSYGTSDDGEVVVGLAWDGCKLAHAFRWEESTGMVDLGSTVEGQSSRANDVSGDGRVVVGWQEAPTGVRTGAKWVNGAQELIKGPGGSVGEAFEVNHDGSLITGGTCEFATATNPLPTPSGWTWTAASGVKCLPVELKVGIPDVPRQVFIMSTSDDGRVMGGALSFGLESESLIWVDGEGFYLKDYLRAHGVPDAFEGWVNTGFVLGMTPDGRTLVGYGAGPKAFQGFMVVLPELSR